MKKFEKGLKKVLLAALFVAAASGMAMAGEVSAVITQIKGAVFVQTSPKAAFHKAKKGEFIYEGATVKTGVGDRAALTFVSGVEVKINEKTTYTILPTRTSRRGQGNDTFLSSGQMWFNILNKKKTKFQIKTPTASAAIRGTEGDIRFENSFHAKCYEGTFNVAALKNGNEEVEDTQGVPVSAGQECTVSGGKGPVVSAMKGAETWQNDLVTSGKGTIKITLSKTEVSRDTAVSFSLVVVDPDGREMRGLNSEVKMISDQEDVEWSRDGQSWARGPIMIPLSSGKGLGWIRISRAVIVNLNSLLEGFESPSARFSVTKPAQKVLDMEIETEKGEKSRVRMKFRRS